MQNPIHKIAFACLNSANRIKFPMPQTKDKNKNYINFYVELRDAKQNVNGLVEINSKFETSISKIANESDNSKYYMLMSRI